jgi:RNA polymerase sigma-70 factor (ECF subfamily)
VPLLPSDISRLYRAHAEQLVAYFARRTYDGEAAVDLTAETFAVAFRQRERFEGAPDEDGIRWIYGIARNQLSTFFRDGRVERRAMERLGVERRELTDYEYERIEELASLATVRARVAAELASMPDEHARVLQLRVVDELSYDEIATALAITEQTARARVSRALRLLGERIEPFMAREDGAHV